MAIKQQNLKGQEVKKRGNLVRSDFAEWLLELLELLELLLELLEWR